MDTLLSRLIYCCGALWWLAAAASAAAQSILFIAPQNANTEHEFLLKERERATHTLALKTMPGLSSSLTGFVKLSNPLSAAGKQLELQQVVRNGNYSVADICNQVQVVVAIGKEAAQVSTQQCRIPILIVLTPYQEASPLIDGARHAPVSAIYLEADPVLNLRLIRQVMPNASRVGVFVLPRSQSWLAAIRAEARQLRVQLDEIEAKNGEDAVRKLRQRIEQLDALLLLPDMRIVNAWSLKPILFMTARGSIPTFGGLTEQYVKAGVMAAVVPDLDRLPDQVAAFAERLSQSPALPPPSVYPTATRVVVNQTVAHAMATRTHPAEQPIVMPSDFARTPSATNSDHVLD